MARRIIQYNVKACTVSQVFEIIGWNVCNVALSFRKCCGELRPIAAIERPARAVIDIAIWHPDTSKWCRSGPRLDYIKGVYAWMPLPEAPEQEEQP